MLANSMMDSASNKAVASQKKQGGDGFDLDLQGFSYGRRDEVVPALNEALSSGYCWLRERRALSPTQVEFCFELQVRSAVELYSDLLAAGVEMTRDTHAMLTSLCLLRSHHVAFAEPAGVARVRLQLAFLNDVRLPPRAPWRTIA